MENKQHQLEDLVRHARKGDAKARTQVALKHLSGRELPYAPEVAAKLLLAAALEDYAPAAARLACLAFCGIGVMQNRKEAKKWLLRAARAGEPLALRNLGFIYTHLATRKYPEWLVRSSACFRAAAIEGDRISQHLLGVRYMVGTGLERNASLGAYWLSRAADQGLSRSRLRLVKLKGVASRQPSSVQGQNQHLERDSLVEFEWPDTASTPASEGPASEGPASEGPAPEELQASPHLVQFDALLSEEECEFLINLVEPLMQRSGTLNPDTGRIEHHPMRSSSERHLDHSLKDIAIHLIEQRWAAVAGLPVANGEPIMLLRYQPGEEYKPHYDWLTRRQIDAHPLSRAGGQRCTTVLSYLSDVEEGGGTAFPRLNLRVEAKQGRGLVIANCTPDGVPDKRTLHAGLPVVRGEKWLATLWFREHALQM